MINTKLGIEAGANVTASYGMVTVNADTKFSYDQASEVAKQTSTNFAKETIDKAVFRVQEKVRKKREKKTFHEIVEKNLHGFDNKKGSSHLIGIYRWLNKKYDNKLINYGKRLLIEIIVPEPAKYYSYANLSIQEKEIEELDKNKPLNPWEKRPTDYPITGLRGKQLFTSKDISESNFLLWAAAYNAQDVDSFPESKTVSISIKPENSDSENVKNLIIVKKEDFGIEDGYIATKWRYDYVIRLHDNDIQDKYWKFFIMLGQERISTVSINDRKSFALTSQTGVDSTINWGSNWEEILNPGLIGKKIPITVTGQKVKDFIVHITIKIEPLPETIEQWQIDTYQKIIEGYQVQLQEYQDNLARLRAAKETANNERNPLINREIEKRELKKGAISFLIESQLGQEELTDDQGNLPQNVTYNEAANKGRFAQFFEQAFEWDNIAYSFYPYFWAHEDEWEKLLANISNDPLFEMFLKAGYARIIVPARFAYKDLVINFLNEKPHDPWLPVDGPPTYNDDLYYDISAEMATSANPDEVLEDEWPSIVPTDLVILQKGTTLLGKPTEQQLFG